MSTKIELKQTRTIASDNSYHVKTEVVYAERIDSSIFVFNTAAGTFSHVAFPYDMITYKNSLEDAQLAGDAYYRASVVDQVFDDVVTATLGATYTRTRVDWLVEQYEAVSDAYLGTFTYTYEAD